MDSCQPERAGTVEKTRLHLDTDFAGDPDDACALAMLLGWPSVEIVGITTTADPDGRRAGYLAHFLAIAEREDIPIEVGAGSSLKTGQPMGALPEHDRYWPFPVAPRASTPTAAVDLLDRNIECGAIVVSIGPYTNLACLEAIRPGRLSDARVVAMGGWVYPPAPGLPSWGPEMDWNIQCDTQAALTVANHAELTMVTMPATLRAHIRDRNLSRLIASGPLGVLLAQQTRAHAVDTGMADLGLAHSALPDDLLNFHYDPVTCAVALGWPGASTVELRLRPVYEQSGALRFEPHTSGRQLRVVIDVDGDAFAETWIAMVESAQR
jgi:purine nucleosidase